MPQNDLNEANNSTSEPAQNIIKSSKLKPFAWFISINAAILVTLLLAFNLIGVPPSDSASIIQIIMLLSLISPFGVLLLSKWLAINNFGIELIDPETEEELPPFYLETKELCDKAGLENTPQIGMYDSDELNAFATGSSKNNALIAFSTGLIKSMDSESFKAVAAHEIGHIVSGDMLTMTILQAAINAVVFTITLPLKGLKLLSFFSDKFSYVEYFFISLAKAIVTVVFVFLGSLISKAFSRRREFKADNFASQLTSRNSMIKALETLEENYDSEIKIPEKQKQYAAFQISSKMSFADFLSTHPSLQRRIERLRETS